MLRKKNVLGKTQTSLPRKVPPGNQASYPTFVECWYGGCWMWVLIILMLCIHCVKWKTCFALLVNWLVCLLVCLLRDVGHVHFAELTHHAITLHLIPTHRQQNINWQHVYKTQVLYLFVNLPHCPRGDTVRLKSSACGFFHSLVIYGGGSGGYSGGACVN